MIKLYLTKTYSTELKKYGIIEKIQIYPKNSKSFLKDTRKQFVRSGALLDESQKKQITEINSKLSELSTEFGQNLLD